MLNKIILMGRICKPIELRQTQSGIAVTTFTIAVDRDFKQGDEKQTDFIDVTAWRGTAEFVSRNFSKGRMIVVEGSLQSRKWTDKNGQNHTAWEVQANNVYFADSKREAQEAPQQAPQQEDFAEIEDAGELPF